MALTGTGVGGALAGEFDLLREGAGIDLAESSNDQSTL